MKEFKVVRGVAVINLNGIFECYSINQQGDRSTITINVSSESIERVFLRLVKEVRLPGFLLFEHGTNENIEKEIRKNDKDPMHKDVFYIDGLDDEAFFDVFNPYKELLINDGEINFGFGSHSGVDEVYIGPYKIFTVFCDELVKYEEALIELGIVKVDRVKTVWETFTQETPGARSVINVNGIDIYEMIERLKEKGLYFAERRED